jgi:hypothetical protein
LLEKCAEVKGKNITFTHTQRPMSYGYYVKVTDYVSIDLLEKYEIPRMSIIYRGSETRQDVAKWFLEDVVTIGTRVRELLKTNVEIIMSDEENRVHSACINCQLSKENFTVSNCKIADHCHLSGKYRQALCNGCNLKVQTPKFISCYLHNLTNYDAHFIITESGYDAESINVIPNSEEKFIAFSKHILRDFSIRFYLFIYLFI